MISQGKNLQGNLKMCLLCSRLRAGSTILLRPAAVLEFGRDYPFQEGFSQGFHGLDTIFLFLQNEKAFYILIISSEAMQYF